MYYISLEHKCNIKTIMNHKNSTKKKGKKIFKTIFNNLT